MTLCDHVLAALRERPSDGSELARRIGLCGEHTIDLGHALFTLSRAGRIQFLEAAGIWAIREPQ